MAPEIEMPKQCRAVVNVNTSATEQTALQLLLELCTIVYGTHWQMPGISQRHHPYVQQCSNMYWPAIGFQHQVQDAVAANQVWRTRLLA